VKDALQTVPTLDELAADPAKAMKLPIEVAKALLVKVAGLQAALLTSALTSALTPTTSSIDRFLDTGEVAAMIGKSRSWVEKNTAELPRRRKVGGEGKWSERDVQQWMKHREFWKDSLITVP
jgi:predicted DNA-binding transcriptional regulator AlpA